MGMNGQTSHRASRQRAPWRRAIENCRGASNLEYLILVGVIAILALGAWRIFGSAIKCAAIAGGSMVRDLDLPQGTSHGSCLEATAAPAAGAGRMRGRPHASWGLCGGGTRPAPVASAIPSATPTASGAPSPPPSPADLMIRDILQVMCPADKAVLADLKKQGVTITAYDRIHS
jgi:hypothetical protein